MGDFAALEYLLMVMASSLPRIAHDELLGDIDVDRMERVMNSEVEAIRNAAGPLTALRQNVIDHFTRNSPQTLLFWLRDRLQAERLKRFIDAVRAVMYEPGQTVVPQGYVIEVSDLGAVRLVRSPRGADP
jgi:hypothetical protein